MPDVPETVTDPALREKLTAIQRRLAEELISVDPHQRLVGRPVSFHVIGGHTFEVVYREVPRIDENELLGVKRLIGHDCFCSITPQSAETLIVRFVIPLKS